MSEIIRHNCGLCVAHTLHDAYSLIKSLQHRGREAAGIAAVGNNRIDVIKWKGPVDRFDIIDLHKIFPASDYHSYMAHVRYATRGRKDQILEDAHPHTIGGEIEDRGDHILIRNCQLAGVHNGQVNQEYLGDIDSEKLNTGCDTEALLHIFQEQGDLAALLAQLVKLPAAFKSAERAIHQAHFYDLVDLMAVTRGKRPGQAANRKPNTGTYFIYILRQYPRVVTPGKKTGIRLDIAYESVHFLRGIGQQGRTLD